MGKRAKYRMAEAEDVEKEPIGNKESAKSSAQLESVTDHHEERDLDASKVNLELAALQEADQADSAAKAARARELAKVAVADEDVALVASEMDISKADAEQALRENEGDAKKTLSALVRQ